MTVLKNGSYYQIKIKAKNNTQTGFSRGFDINEIFLLTNATFRGHFGRGFSIYEASLMAASLTVLMKLNFLNQEENLKN